MAMVDAALLAPPFYQLPSATRFDPGSLKGLGTSPETRKQYDRTGGSGCVMVVAYSLVDRLATRAMGKAAILKHFFATKATTSKTRVCRFCARWRRKPPRAVHSGLWTLNHPRPPPRIRGAQQGCLPSPVCQDAGAF